MKTLLLGIVSLTALSHTSHAIILFGATDGGVAPSGLPLDSVGQLPGGTGIHLGNGYVLTAAHVNPISSITFDGSTFFNHDGQTPVQIGNTDLKVFRLATTPTVAAVSLYTGNSELLESGTLVGTGIGRDSTAVGTTVVPWGSTREKRFGTNTPTGLVDDFSYSVYTFDAIQTTLGSDAGLPPGTGDFEAATVDLDSGSALFQNFGGNWFLTGVTSVVTQRSGARTSTFGNDLPAAITPGSPSGISLAPGSGDINLFVRISPYAAEIAQSIPEPSTILFALGSLSLLLRRRRQSPDLPIPRH